MRSVWLRKFILGVGLGVCITFLFGISTWARQIEIWTSVISSQNANQWMQTVLLPKFQKERGIEVFFKQVTSQELSAQLRRKQGPDVLITYVPNGNSYGAYGYLQSLNQFFNRWNDRKFISPNLVTYETKTKNLYSLPISTYFYGVSYNKQAFSKAGVSIKSLPSSWEALKATAEKLNIMWNGRIARTGIETDWDHFSWQAFMLQLGETGISDDGRRSQLASEKAIEALNYMAGLHQMEYPSDRLARGEEGKIGNARSFFPDNTTAMGFTITSAAFYTQVRNRNWQQEYGFFPLRRYPSLDPVALAFTYGIGITSWARDTQAAWEFITWLYTPENLVLYNAQMNFIPTRTDLADTVVKVMPVAASCYASLKYAKLLPEGPPILTFPSQQSSNSFQDNLREVLKGKLDAGALLYQMQGDVQSILDRYWLQKDAEANAKAHP